MSASKQDIRVARTTEKKRLRNRSVRRSVKTRMVQAKSSANAGEESAPKKIKLAISSIDRAVSKGIIHKNKGARLKSRLMKQVSKK